MVVYLFIGGLVLLLLIFFFVMRHRRVSVRLGIARLFHFELELEDPDRRSSP